ncbi:MAG: bacterial regulatory s, tetR family protein [Rhizobium sp.]|nr:bacterial regulatory s, tetR family protein [Rhizobium sp.]
MTQKKAYHHGDLRQALLQTALDMIEETGLEGLSLRKIAARVGVSHAAPEHHFPSLRHLMNAMAGEGFVIFTRSITDERRSSSSDPAEQIRAASRGYLNYARAHPALFRLMFNAGLLDWSDDDLREKAGKAYDQLREICAPAADFRGLKTEAERASLEQLVWSQIHGQAHLMIDQKLPDPDGGECPPVCQPLDIAGLLFHR